MKIAVFGSRNIKKLDLGDYLPKDTTEIVSGGAAGVDTVAANYAKANGIKLVEFLPDYDLYGKRAPIIRNKLIAEYADEGIAFWDGRSKGTVYTIKFFKEFGKKVVIYVNGKNTET